MDVHQSMTVVAVMNAEGKIVLEGMTAAGRMRTESKDDDHVKSRGVTSEVAIANADRYNPTRVNTGRRWSWP